YHASSFPARSGWWRLAGLADTPRRNRQTRRASKRINAFWELGRFYSVCRLRLKDDNCDFLRYAAITATFFDSEIGWGADFEARLSSSRRSHFALARRMVASWRSCLRILAASRISCCASRAFCDSKPRAILRLSFLRFRSSVE